MLASLSIQNVVLIEKLNIEFREGLCAMTGETGAGKSILLDALGLALGARSESALVRKGAEQAQVTAEFSVPKNHPSLKILKDANLEGDTSLLLRRVVGTDGRSRAFINDQPVSAGLLKQIGETLVEIHGQFETQGLLNVSTHREILDEYAFPSLTNSPPSGRGQGRVSQDHSALSLPLHPHPNPLPEGRGGLSEAWNVWKEYERELIRLKDDAEKSRAEETYLRQALEDLDSLNPEEGEENHLSGLRERLIHREKVLQALNAASAALTEENDPVRRAWAALDRVADKIGTDGQAAIAALGRASAETQEALALIQSVSADLEESEHNLETIDERLYQLRAQARKHNCTVDELPAMRQRLGEKLNLIEHADDVLAAQTKAVEKARKAYEAGAAKASETRQKAAKKLDTLVQKELPPLKMEKAKFLTSIDKLPESEWGAYGWDRVRFLVSTNPGAEPGPLNKIASGGEMARFMLALKVVMADVGSQSLIFDEADSGIGGAVADAVGERLSRLAKTRQVLVVTHSPQVAARADHHFIVKKDGAKEIKTNIVHLEKNSERREEIARMLSGAKVTAEARAAADKLLETGT